jgi:RimJ/RimL family protein N-acetyltransferase
MVEVLANQDLYGFTGGEPPTLANLQSQYTAQVAGPSSGEEVWHNWIIRPKGTGKAVGFVQATVTGDASDVAWVVGVEWQGRGFASEAAAAMCEWLAGQGVEKFTAHIHPGHVASQRVAASIGLQATDEVDEDGEVVWASIPRPAGRTAE